MAKKERKIEANLKPSREEEKKVNGINKIWKPYQRSAEKELIAENCVQGKEEKLRPFK